MSAMQSPAGRPVPTPRPPDLAYNAPHTTAPNVTPCSACPLRGLDCFRPVSAMELDIIAALKRGERRLQPGEALFGEEDVEVVMGTVLAGWAYRYRSLPAGQTQVLSFLLPGDVVGLQQNVDPRWRYGVRAITEATVCEFVPDAVRMLHKELPTLGYDVTALATRAWHGVDSTLLNVGQRDAPARMAALLLELHGRATDRGLADEQGAIEMPLTQRHLAYALGLSLVHTNRTLRELGQRGYFTWAERGRFALLDGRGLAAVAGVRWPAQRDQQPLI